MDDGFRYLTEEQRKQVYIARVKNKEVKFIYGLDNLRELEINDDSEQKTDINILSSFFCEFKKLNSLTISGNDMSNKDCVSLSSTPKLSVIKLADGCYNSMFKGCRSLTVASDLSALTLFTNCYNSMFDGCSSLVYAPNISAISLAEGCYRAMFYDCTSLSSVQEILNGNVAYPYCFDLMFYNCKSLIKAPELPATTLSTYCYSQMFRYCTNLIKAPELPALNLAQYCYNDMFQGCTSLAYGPII